MKDKMKGLLDWLSPKTPSPEVQEAERDNLKFDNKKLDQSIAELVRTKDYFATIIQQVVEDVKAERRQRRKDEKTSSRTHKD